VTVTNSSRPRNYVSPVRNEAARRTRERIVRAATDCFTRAGYSATTLKAIASAAGVSVETVNNNGPKRDLLLAAFTTAFGGREDLRTMADHPAIAASLESDDPADTLDVLLAALVDAFANSDGIWRALSAAADQDPEVAAALDAMLERRHADFVRLVDELEQRGMPIGPDRDRRVDAAVAIVSHETYHQLVVRRGWSRADYRAWLARSVVHVLTDDAR